MEGDGLRRFRVDWIGVGDISPRTKCRNSPINKVVKHTNTRATWQHGMHKGDHRTNEGRGGEEEAEEREGGGGGSAGLPACFLMWIDGLMAVA